MNKLLSKRNDAVIYMHYFNRYTWLDFFRATFFSQQYCLAFKVFRLLLSTHRNLSRNKFQNQIHCRSRFCMRIIIIMYQSICSFFLKKKKIHLNFLFLCLKRVIKDNETDCYLVEHFRKSEWDVLNAICESDRALECSSYVF